MQNFSERKILWSLCSVDFHTLTLQLPIQTPHSVAPELQVFVSSLLNCHNFRKTSIPQLLLLYFSVTILSAKDITNIDTCRYQVNSEPVEDFLPDTNGLFFRETFSLFN